MISISFCFQLMNHKEAIRQMSELEDDDFSLLECAVAESLGTELGHQTSAVPLHIGLKVEDLEEVSIAEQLENLLEKLRMDAVGHISTDSGTVSDVDSPKNALEEDQMKMSDKVPPLDVCDTASSSAQPSEETPGTDDPSVQSSCKRYRVVSSNETMSRSLDKHTPRERRRKGDRVEDGRIKPKENTLQLKHPQAPGQRPPVARGRVIQQVPHKEGYRELDMKMEQLTEAQPEQQECSLAEGGPFITHWGKGRWKRNGGRNWNRKPQNSQSSLSRQRFSAPGGPSRPRYHTRNHNAAEHTTSDKHSQNHRKQVTMPKDDLPAPQNKTKPVPFESPTCQQKAPSPKPTVSTVPATQNTVPSTVSEKTHKRLTYASIAGSSKASVTAQPRAQRTTATADDILHSNKAIAASFNYTEVVQFLWTSEYNLSAVRPDTTYTVKKLS